MCVPVSVVIAGVLVSAGPLLAQGRGAATGGLGRGAEPVVRLSTRLEAFSSFHTFAAAVIGWEIGIPVDVFRQLTFSEALGKADSLLLAAVEGSSSQELSREIPKKLDYNLKPGEVAALKNELRAWNIRMPAYFTPTIGPDEDSSRRLFEFAKSAGVATIVSDPDPQSLAAIDKLAAEFGINVALYNRNRKETPAYWNPQSLLEALKGRSNRIGAAGDVTNWIEAGIKPADALAQLKDRLLVVNLRELGVASLSAFLREIDRLELKPTLITVDGSGAADTFVDLSRSLERFDKALQPIMGERVDQISRTTPSLHIDPSMPADEQRKMEAQMATDLARYGFTPAEEKQRIDAALPQRAPAKPRKPRRLLVLDLCVGYSGHIASRFWVNYALDAMGKRTGAYEAVFSNDLDNLKYGKINQFDAVYLNNTVGQIFADQAVRDGLSRFVREGGGLAGNHGAGYASLDWKEFGDMLGTVHGVHRENTEKAMVRVDDPSSPLTASFHGQEFLYMDEYFRFPVGPYSREKLHVLLSMDVAKTDMNQGLPCSRPCSRPDNDYAISWIHNHGKGRVFYCGLGHQPTLFATPSLAAYFLAGVQFILGDLDADTTPSARLAPKK